MMPPASQKYQTAMRDLLESPTNAVANAGREAARPKRLRYCTTSDHAAWGPPAAGETARATSPVRETTRIPGRAPSYQAWPDRMTQATQISRPHGPALRPNSPGPWI